MEAIRKLGCVCHMIAGAMVAQTGGNGVWHIRSSDVRPAFGDKSTHACFFHSFQYELGEGIGVIDNDRPESDVNWRLSSIQERLKLRVWCVGRGFGEEEETANADMWSPVCRFWYEGGRPAVCVRDL